MKAPSFLTSIAGYRLGYGLQRAYPWPWTTPVALAILLTSTVVLTLVNIPLSAYDLVQELTYFPNATLSKLPMTNMIPSFLRESSVSSFTPQTWTVGDTFRLNSSIFQLTVASALDQTNNMTPVNSFSYSNVAFSENCDVTSITVSVQRTVDTQSTTPYQYYACDASGYITCNLPTRVELTATLPGLGYGSSIAHDGDIMQQMTAYALDLQVALYVDILGGPDETARGDETIRITARPCCNCTIGDDSDDFLQAEAQALLQPPCSSLPSSFVGTAGFVKNASAEAAPWGVFFTQTGTNSSDLFAGIPNDWRDGYVGKGDLSILDDPFRNLFQVYYHLLRRDLGVLLDNQIYGSPEMYNRSIVLLNPGAGLDGTPFGMIAPSAAVSYHALLNNDTVMQEWRDSIKAFDETDRAPVLEYFRLMPRRKSLGSAITSVFSATFAMVLTVWTIFSMVARAFVLSSRHHGMLRTPYHRVTAAEDAGWEVSKDRPSFEESKWGSNGASSGSPRSFSITDVTHK
ncbi:hypothetical protein C8R45DRAFT_1147981 [Mycena sanguinolenta]|nr:hypothetical protein C8R45DRAFT_1147981 [Mycena sanguinolenta]